MQKIIYDSKINLLTIWDVVKNTKIDRTFIWGTLHVKNCLNDSIQKNILLVKRTKCRLKSEITKRAILENYKKAYIKFWFSEKYIKNLLEEFTFSEILSWKIIEEKRINKKTWRYKTHKMFSVKDKVYL